MGAVALDQRTPDVEATPAPPASPSRTLKVTAAYWLSEAGRKAALLAGLDGRARQTPTLDVPLPRLHLVTVDAQGVPRLMLRPQYERRGDDQIVRIETSPTFDAPPTLEDLYAVAARNYELARLYDAQRAGVRTQRIDAERELRARVTQAFLADASQRALPHPAPTAMRCFIQTEQGRRVFDVNTDEGLARELPPEAHRRFRADLRARRERNQEAFKAQRALHEEKVHALASWIAAHGTPDQQARQAAGVLPIAEAVDAMTDQVFAAANGCELYAHDGDARLQAHLRLHPGYENAVVTSVDLLVTNTQPPTATKAQWVLLQQIRNALPEAVVFLRTHRLIWRRDSRAPSLTVHSAVAVQRVGLFTLRREYTAPD
jgi:hypothetical protein